VSETVFEAVRPAPVLSLEAQLRATVEQCFRRAEAYLHHRFDRPHVLLNLRGMTAALADCTRNVLRFNRSLYEHNAPDFLRVTVPHEVSHLIAYRLHGRHISPHGAEWATIMGEIFKLAPQRCHDYDVRPGMAAAYRYHCGCPEGHLLTTRRHRSAQRGRRYYCRRCRQALAYSHPEKAARAISPLGKSNRE
jgi:SprT protein